MNSAELILLAIGLAMDAFAVSIYLGLNLPQAKLSESLIIGSYFAVFQAVMPILGYLMASLFAEQIVTYDHWIAFGLLAFLGVRMIIGGLKENRRNQQTVAVKQYEPGTLLLLRPANMLPLAVATSIDALAVGISFAFLQVDILPAISIIGLVTLVLSMLAVKIGKIFGSRLRSGSEVVGGIILILIGLKILLEHLQLFSL